MDRSLPAGTVLRLAPHVRSWANSAALIGGSPWRVSRMTGAARTVAVNLVGSGSTGVVASDPKTLAIFRMMVDRGFAIVVPGAASGSGFVSVSVVIPAMDRTYSLDRTLASLAGPGDVIVVDDGSADPSALLSVAASHGASVAVHAVNRGPAAARNTGIAASSGEFVAFLDSDCVAPPGWPGSMLHHFADPAVAAVAPRVRANPSGRSLIDRYEATRSSLDMGVFPELVRPGSRLGFVPTAALMVRRSALGTGFDEDLRLGEDVDLVWRLTDAGWHVLYDPSVIVAHATRARPREWLTRRFEYGTSAAALSARHPDKLTPARVSVWNLAALGLLAVGRPRAGVVVAGGAAGALSRQLKALDNPELLAARIVGQGVVADAAGIGHLLRREWWPAGAAALALSPRSRIARTLAACMLAPIAWEYATRRPRLDPVRYLGLRLLDDAAYGTGVLASCVRARTLAPATPAIRMPMWAHPLIRTVVQRACCQPD